MNGNLRNQNKIPASSLLRASKAVIWKLKTAIFKKQIALQDRFGLYSYQRWITQHEANIHKHSIQNTQLLSLEYQPLISFFIHYEEVRAEEIQKTLTTIMDQTYQNWEVCLVLDLMPDSDNAGDINTLTRECDRTRILRWKQDVNPEKLMFEALKMALGEFVMWLEPGDTLSSNMLYAVVKSLNSALKYDIIYFDEDQLAEDGTTRQAPFFKPDWSPELMISINYLLHAVFRRDLLLEVIGQGSCKEKDCYEDLIFRAIENTPRIHHIPLVLYHAGTFTRAIPIGSDSAQSRHCRWLEAHLERSGIQSAKAFLTIEGDVQVTWPVEGKKVSIIIPTKDHVEYLRKCINSIRELTNYKNYEFVLVDSGSCEEATHKYYSELRQDSDFHFVDYISEEFNFSAVLNLGARHAPGEILLFLNNDTEVIDPEWLDELVRWAERPEIGIVGAKLLYPDKTIQHAGIVVGLEGHASHVFSGAREGHRGPFGFVEWYRNYSAVTGACMAMRTEVFEEIDGFDESYQLVFSDIEICLRAIKAGYRVVYTPFARLIHHEGKTRYQHISSHDIKVGYAHLKITVEHGDPYYNPNLSSSVRIPTLRRHNEERPITRLINIYEQAS